MDPSITPPAGPAAPVAPVSPDTAAQRALARHEHRLPAPLFNATREAGQAAVVEGGIARLAQLQRALPPPDLPGSQPVAHAVFPWTASAEAVPLATTQSALLIKRATEPAAALADLHTTPAPGTPAVAVDAGLLTNWTSAVNAGSPGDGAGSRDADGQDRQPPGQRGTDTATPARSASGDAAPGADHGMPTAGGASASPATPATTTPATTTPAAAPGHATPADDGGPPGSATLAPDTRASAAQPRPTPESQPAPQPQLIAALPQPDPRWLAPEPRPTGLALLDIAEDGRHGAQQEGAAPLIATLRLQLPNLGPVELRLALSGTQADLSIYAGKEALATLAAGASSLAGSLSAWGISSSTPSYSPIRKS
ncbi:flagellar hook-length control protein FliK [Derxia gummosa]|uniref:Flagellar hook-length control protein FliK n=1 Tax=Derxia gummosa DSM 723 TaxID=1121388 RepID=A0A9U5C3A5_9BURK|nr:flagellar hook-length control protein FliK [Derxia gummosa]